ncbi:hypothetical protein [Bradyrhizobium macuxiense]|uniref:hypothetical protein n=1 Tax=Bradyrhizobium macuxiense TaxID=1755647 RepID=UPI0010A96935|nr:hypothetical protein [Bradyrhizobium macuxiense]
MLYVTWYSTYILETLTEDQQQTTSKTMIKAARIQGVRLFSSVFIRADSGGLGEDIDSRGGLQVLMMWWTAGQAVIVELMPGSWGTDQNHLLELLDISMAL